MSNYVEIANLAAIKIGTQARITDPKDDTVLARKIAAAWDIERKATIREGSWNFAMRRAALAIKLGITAYPWAFGYAMPANALRLVQVLNAGIGSDYQLEGGHIYSNDGPPLIIRYLADVKETGLWDEAFAEAFACRLAWKCGKSIAGSTYSEDNGAGEFAAAMAAAKRTDAMENPRIEQEESLWVMARYGAVEPVGWR